MGASSAKGPEGTGRVSACGTDYEGYHVFTIKWDKPGFADGKYFTYGVLRDAVEEQSAESLASTTGYMANALCAVLCDVNTHVVHYIRARYTKNPVFKTLTGKQLEETTSVREWAWTKLPELVASQTMSQASLALREDFHGTAGELREAGILGANHLDSAHGDGFNAPEMSNRGFNGKQLKYANQNVSAFLSAIRLGRPVLLQSIFFPMVPAELPTGTIVPELETRVARVSDFCA